MNLPSIQEMVHVTPLLGMVTTLFCYDESKPSGGETYFHVDNIVEGNEKGEPNLDMLASVLIL